MCDLYCSVDPLSDFDFFSQKRKPPPPPAEEEEDSKQAEMNKVIDEEEDSGKFVQILMSIHIKFIIISIIIITLIFQL